MMNGEGQSFSPDEKPKIIPFDKLAGNILAGKNSSGSEIKVVSGESGMPETLQEIAGEDRVVRPEVGYFDTDLNAEVIPHDKFGHRDDQIGNIYHTDNPNPQFLRDILVPKKEDPNLERDIENFLANQTISARPDIERRIKDYLKSNDVPFTKESGINILLQKYRAQEALKKDKQKLIDLQAEIDARQSVPANVIGMDSKPLQNVESPDLISEAASDPTISTPESLGSKQNALVKKLEGVRDDPNIRRLYEQVKQGGNVVSNAVETINKVRTATPGKMVKMFGGQLVKGFMGLFSDSSQPQQKAA